MDRIGAWATRAGTVVILLAAAALGVLAVSAAAAIQASFNCVPSCEVPTGTTVTFASNSSSSSRIRNHQWDLDGDGLHGVADDPDEPYGPNAQRAQRAFPAAGEYQVGLRVTNADAEESTTTRIIRVGSVPRPSPEPEPEVEVEPLRPPRPTADEDGDGVSNARDLCPRTAAGLRAVQRGCALLEAIVSPAALLASAAESVARTRAELRHPKRIRRATRGSLKRLNLGLGRLSVAGERLAGDPCLGSRVAGSALGSVRKGVTGVSTAVTRQQRSVVAQIGRMHLRRPKSGGDTEGLDISFSSLDFKRAQARETLRELARLRGLFASACRARVGGRKRTLSARLVEIDPTHSLARLSDGHAVALGAADQVSALGPGMTVDARGTLLKGGILVADKVTGRGRGPELQPGPCRLIPRIAPVQDYAQSPKDLLYFDQRGYLDGARYVLEGGMAIGAERVGDCTGYDDYRLNVFLSYRNATGANKQGTWIGSLRGFPGSEPPAWIPQDIHPSFTANQKSKLTFELWGYQCTGLGECGSARRLSRTESPATVRRKGSWGTAMYDRNRFSVEDGVKTDFDTATLVGASTPPGWLPNAGVYGLGFGLNGGQSTFPNPQYILDDQGFAVHDDVPEPDPAAYEDDTWGIPGGLLWAYIHGLRDGHPYHYWASLPNIVTDTVSFCPTKARDSYYRLPWQAGKVHRVTQGNDTQSTHKDNPDTLGTDQRFAFDFKMPLHTHGWAPRGGLVERVEEKLTETSDPKTVEYWDKLSGGLIKLKKNANELRLRHQDGTVAQYFHMIPEGVRPEEDDLVERGDWVVVVGNTGNSTGPHLHYHVMDRFMTGTMRILFEVRPIFDGVFGPVSTCTVPDKNAWGSTNTQPDS
jgi:Peptidase family M23